VRVNFIGNTCNNHYGLCKFLRKAGVDAQLFYDRRGDIQTFPEAEDAFLADQPADWVHPYEGTDVGPHPWHHIPPAFMARLADCDLLQAESEGLLWAWQSGKPYIWSYIGADLNFFSYHTYWSRRWNEAHPEHLLTPWPIAGPLSAPRPFGGNAGTSPCATDMVSCPGCCHPNGSPISPASSSTPSCSRRARPGLWPPCWLISACRTNPRD
jgi:hypothetical protein